MSCSFWTDQQNVIHELECAHAGTSNNCYGLDAIGIAFLIAGTPPSTCCMCLRWPAGRNTVVCRIAAYWIFVVFQLHGHGALVGSYARPLIYPVYRGAIMIVLALGYVPPAPD